MAILALSLCRFNPFAGGTTDFVVSTALSGCAKPFDVGAINAKVYRYYAASADGTQWESGTGAYNSSTQTVARTTIIASSNNGSKTNFSAAPVVDLFGPWVNALTPEYANLPQATLNLMSPIPAGSVMVFHQTTAPTGWTKRTDHNDKAMRVVSGTITAGGVNTFSSTFAYRTDDPTTLSIPQIPSHAHSELYSVFGTFTSGPGVSAGSDYQISLAGTNTGANGGSGSHAHTYDMRVQYIDVILATKN